MNRKIDFIFFYFNYKSKKELLKNLKNLKTFKRINNFIFFIPESSNSWIFVNEINIFNFQNIFFLKIFLIL